MQIKPSRYIQAHTILKTLVPKYTNSPVLVLGGKNDTVRLVAERYIRSIPLVTMKYSILFPSYGFGKAYTALDVLAWNPS